MNIRKKIILGYSYCSALFLNKKRPFFISWELTRRCNLRCKYCNVWNKESPELETFQILEIIKELFEHGTRVIKFTGGEPLLRDDIAEIINYTRGLGIFTTITTNGFLFPAKIKEIKKLDGVSITLEGPEDIHDSIRGPGSYKIALAALETANKENIPIINIFTTLNSLNLNSMGYLLSMAEIFNSKIFFQPATDRTLYGGEHNPISPDVNQYRKTVLSLIKLKKRNIFIGNSMAGLRHLYSWPNKKTIKCMAGKIICRLDPEGNIRACPRFIMKNSRLNIIEKGIDYCLNQLYPPNCGNCWCSMFVELNIISMFNINAFIDAVKNLAKLKTI